MKCSAKYGFDKTCDITRKRNILQPARLSVRNLERQQEIKYKKFLVQTKGFHLNRSVIHDTICYIRRNLERENKKKTKMLSPKSSNNVNLPLVMK